MQGKLLGIQSLGFDVSIMTDHILCNGGGVVRGEECRLQVIMYLWDCGGEW